VTESPSPDARFTDWLAALEALHLADLKFAEVSRALRALSSTYVERRGGIAGGAALEGAGKRAAFALFYGPLHFLLVNAIVQAIPAADPGRLVVDLGCGTGAAGAAWAVSAARPPALLAIDRSAWALDQARSTARHFGLRARTVRASIERVPLPAEQASLLAAFALNELPEPSREALLGRLLDRGARGDRVLVVEPIARGAAPWWGRWSDRVRASGGRADEWRFPIARPPLIEKLDRAAGLDHRVLTARSLWIG
jgi:SAM-dependent methyltransferase